MATPTYDLLDSTTLSSIASSVTFSSIDQSYRDLVIVIDGTTTGGTFTMRLNSDTGANYSAVRMQGDGSSTQSVTFATGVIGQMTTTQSSTIIQLMDYSATDKHKTALSRSNRGAPGGAVQALAYRYASTSAITSVEFTGSTFNANSTFHLYGVAA